MVIEVSDVWKRFRLREDRVDGFAKLMVRMFLSQKRINRPSDFWALREINFSVPDNTSFGIVGVNGSGKSTMLKLLTGTMKPTKGHIRVKGRKSSLIELGAGFHSDFSGRDNVYLNGLILGLSKADIRKRFDEIVDFAELEEFIDVPVKYYSSGMQARLGFAVATAVEPDILIVDEVLAVGDMNFREKCMTKIMQMQAKGVSVVLVSHGLGDVERVCQRAMWLDHGRMMAYGPATEVVSAYSRWIQ